MTAYTAPDNRKLFYNTIADNFDEMMNPFDLMRRIDTVFNSLLPLDLSGLSLLEVGCGTGWFSKEAKRRGAQVVSLDVGIELLKVTLKKAQVSAVTGDALSLPFQNNTFDILLSSDVIEHTVDPKKAIYEMSRVLKTEGTLALTCPNAVWAWLVNLAGALHLRQFHGYENFLGYRELEDTILEMGLVIKQHVGIHPWPFQIRPLWGMSQWIDRSFGKGFVGRLMINQAISAVKKG